MMEEMDEVHRVVYRVVMPLMVPMGIVANTLCLLVLTRPNLMSMRVNWYFLALASSDLLVCIFHIPVITTVTGCIFSSYAEAFYFAHFGWTTIGVCQTFGSYIIIWLSFDRFIAVWMYDIYPKIQQQPNVKRNRLLVTAAACIVFHLIYMILADVQCFSKGGGNVACSNEKWISVSGYQYQFDHLWHKIYSVFFGLFIRWVPSCLLVFFNASLVVGVIQGRVNLPVGSQTPDMNGERKLVIITIAITVSYILFTFPIMVYITGYAEALPDRCSGSYPKEALRAVGNVLQLLEHVIHIFFLLGLNSRFRMELQFMLRLVDREEGRRGEVKSRCGACYSTTEEGRKDNLELPRSSSSPNSYTSSRLTLSQNLDASAYNVAAL